MNAEFFQSWKGSFAIAAVVTIAITGYKIATHRDHATVVIEQQISVNFPNGEPSDTLRASVMKEPYYGMVLPSTLGEFERYLISTGGAVQWEPVGERTFILRFERYDQLADVTYNFGMQFEVLNETGHANLRQEPSPGTVFVTGVIANSETLTTAAVGAFTYQMDNNIRSAIASGKIQ